MAMPATVRAQGQTDVALAEYRALGMSCWTERTKKNLRAVRQRA
jgi:hypothetical protein